MSTRSFAGYPYASTNMLLERLAYIEYQRCNLIGDIAQTEAALAATKIAAYQESLSNTEKGKEWAANVASQGLARDLIDQRANLRICEIESEFIRLLLATRPVLPSVDQIAEEALKG